MGALVPEFIYMEDNTNHTEVTLLMTFLKRRFAVSSGSRNLRISILLNIFGMVLGELLHNIAMSQDPPGIISRTLEKIGIVGINIF